MRKGREAEEHGGTSGELSEDWSLTIIRLEFDQENVMLERLGPYCRESEILH